MSLYHRLDLSGLPTRTVFSHGEMAKEADDWEHTGEWWRITIYEYDGWIEFKGRRFDLTPGTVIVLPPRAHFKQDRYGEDLMTMYSNFVPTESGEQFMAIPVCTHLGDTYLHRRTEWLRNVRRLQLSVLPARAMLYQLLWILAEPLSKYRRHAAVDAAEEYFEIHMGESISISEMSEEIGISHNQLIRLFRQEHGLTPAAYLRNRRAEEARRLLTTTDEPIKQIAARVGVPNLHSFNSFTRDYFGMGPRQLRETAQGP